MLNNNFRFDENDSLSLSINDKWEEREKKVFENNIYEGNTVVDIGSHIGIHSIIFAKLVGNDGNVISFEPDPRNFELLKKNRCQ